MTYARMISAIDVHACGEPGRVITGGVLDVAGNTMFEKMTALRDGADHLRKWMLREPRGYPAMCCNVILPPTDARADAGFVIMEQTEYPPMSGSNTICVATALIETGMVTVTEPMTSIVLETPAGLIEVQAEVRGGKATSITFENVPAFATHLDATLSVPELGDVTVDVAWGGMFFVIADADALQIDLNPANGAQIARVGEMIKRAAQDQLEVVHPANDAIRGVTISQLSGSPHHEKASRRNAVVVSTGVVDWDRPDTWTGVLDRSPCGTGTCAKMAVLHARGLLQVNEPFVHEGLLDTTFTGRIVPTTQMGGYAAIVPTITGAGWITGFSQYVLDATDPFPEGFTLGDLWAGSP